MTNIEQLLRRPGIGNKVVQKSIGLSAGQSATVPVGKGSSRQALKTTVLQQTSTNKSTE